MQRWQVKLQAYKPEEVESALLAYNGPFFPDAGLIVTMIEERRQIAFANKQNAAWDEYRDNQAQAEAEGRMATDEDYAELRKTFTEIIAKPMSKERAEQIKQGFAEAKNAHNSAADGRVLSDPDKLGLEKSATDAVPKTETFPGSTAAHSGGSGKAFGNGEEVSVIAK